MSLGWKVGCDISAGTVLGVLNGLGGTGTLILNAVIVLGRVVIEIIQLRKAKKKRENETTTKDSSV